MSAFDVFVQVVATTATVVSVVKSAASLFALLECRKVGMLGNLNPTPIVLGCMSTFGWFIYGVMASDVYLIVSQIGLFFGFFGLVTVFYLLGVEHRIAEIRIQEYIVYFIVNFWALAGLYMGIWGNAETNSAIIGYACMIFALSYHGAPVTKIPFVIKTKDASCMHRPTLIINNLNNLCWIIYGLAIDDYVVWAPSCATFVSNSIFLALTVIYPVAKGEERVWTHSSRALVPVMGIPRVADADEEALLLESMNENDFDTETSQHTSLPSQPSRSRSGTFQSVQSMHSDSVNPPFAAIGNFNDLSFLPASYVLATDHPRQRSGTVTSMRSNATSTSNAVGMSSPYFQPAAARIRSNSNYSSSTNASSIPAGFTLVGHIINPGTGADSLENGQSAQSAPQFVPATEDQKQQNQNQYSEDALDSIDPVEASGVPVLTRNRAPTLIETIQEVAEVGHAEGFDLEALGMEILYNRVRSLTMALNPFESESEPEPEPEPEEREIALTLHNTQQSQQQGSNLDSEFAPLGPLGAVKENLREDRDSLMNSSPHNSPDNM